MFVITLLSRLPLRLLYLIADILAFIAYHVVRYRIRVVRNNIALCFPHYTAKQREDITRKFYHHLADIVVEALWFGGCSSKQLREQHIVEVLNPETLTDVAANGRSVVILNGHFGNWELSGGIMYYNYTDKPSVVSEKNYVIVYRALNNCDDFFRKNRMAHVVDKEAFEGYLESYSVLRYVMKHREQQKLYTFITDQHPYRSAKGILPVVFCGQQCTTMAAAANLAQHFGFSVVYQRMRNQSRGHYTYEYIPITQDASQTTSQDIMNRYYELLTEDVMSQPEQYLWSHKRFR